MRRHGLTLVAVVVVALFSIAVFVLQDDAADPPVGGDAGAAAGPVATSPSATVPGPVSTDSATDSTDDPRITTSASLYFGRPFETIEIPGTYDGVTGPATLRLQVKRRRTWTDFPLPVVTQESGVFRAYVEMGAGQYDLRLVDPSTGAASAVLTLLLF